MLGRAAVAMWWDVAPEMRGEWEDWHTREHMPERLSIPGFLRGSRWLADAPMPSYFVLYEVAYLETITSGPYLERLNHPTPWSRRMMPHHRNMVRSLCRVRASYGDALPRAMATLRFSGDAPKLPRRDGLACAALLESQAMPAPTTEQKIRGMDGTAEAILLVGGSEANAVKAAAREIDLREPTVGLYSLAHSLSAAA